MTDGFRVGSQATDSVTGRYFFSPFITNTSLSTGTGVSAQFKGVSYQVTAGKTFYLNQIMCLGGIAANNSTAYLAYADDSAMTTNRVSLRISLFTYAATFNVTGLYVSVGQVQVPATKYLGVFNPSVSTETTGYYYLIGYEA